MEINLQLATVYRSDLPSASVITEWVEQTLGFLHKTVDEITVRVVDEAEIVELNQDYRGQQGATNVLTFVYDAPPETGLSLLGDIVVCAAVVEREARWQNKTLNSHWALMVVHSVLHLCGYDHLGASEAAQMQQLERQILAALGFTDPYLSESAG